MAALLLLAPPPPNPEYATAAIHRQKNDGFYLIPEMLYIYIYTTLWSILSIYQYSIKCWPDASTNPPTEYLEKVGLGLIID